MTTIGKRLREARQRKRLSQVEVFKRTGINNKTLSRYEIDGTEPDADSLRRLSEVYNVSVDWIIKNKESAGTLPESEYERVIAAAEARYGVSLRDDPVVLAAMRQMIDVIAQERTKKDPL